MSVIDRFVVELALDPKKFSGPAKKAVEDLRTFEKQAGNAGNSIEGVGRKGADAFAGVRREALAMLAVFTAGRSLKAFVSDTTKANTQLDYMSQRLNMDPGGLTRLETAAKAAGGTFGEVTQSFAALQQRLTDPQQWAQVTRAFTQLGVTDFTDEHGRIRADIVSRLNKGIHANHVDNAVATGYLKDLGFGDGVINQALMDPTKFRQMQADFSKIRTPSKAQLEASQQLYQDWVLLTGQSEQLTNQLVSNLAPGLDAVLKQFIHWEQEHPSIAGVIGGSTLLVNELGKSLGGLGSILASLASVSLIKRLFGSDSKALKAALEEIKAMRSGLGLPGAAIPEAAPAVSGVGVLARLMSYGGAVIEGFRLNSAINADRKDVNDLAKAVQKGSVTNSPMFGAMASAVAGIEGASYGQMGGSSGKYAGRYQMSPDAIKEAAAQLGEATPTQEGFLRDPAMQERYFKAYTKQNEWYLLRHNEQFRSMNDAQKLSVLAYAHNQGAAGADKWIRTGVDGKDAFGTSGSRYANDTLNALGKYAASRSGVADNPKSSAPTTTTILRYDASKADQDAAVKRLKDVQTALREQMTQIPKAIGTDPSAQMAASVTAGYSPGSQNNQTTTNNATNFHGDIVINTQATDGKGVVDAFKDHFNRRSILAVNSPGLQ